MRVGSCCSGRAKNTERGNNGASSTRRAYLRVNTRTQTRPAIRESELRNEQPGSYFERLFAQCPLEWRQKLRSARFVPPSSRERNIACTYTGSSTWKLASRGAPVESATVNPRIVFRRRIYRDEIATGSPIRARTLKIAGPCQPNSRIPLRWPCVIERCYGQSRWHPETAVYPLRIHILRTGNPSISINTIQHPSRFPFKYSIPYRPSVFSSFGKRNIDGLTVFESDANVARVKWANRRKNIGILCDRFTVQSIYYLPSQGK